MSSFRLESYKYRDYRIDLHPSAGGFRAFIFRPGEGNGLQDAPSLAGPDGQERVNRELILKASVSFVDRHIAAAFAAAGPLTVVDGGKTDTPHNSAPAKRKRAKPKQQ